MAERTERGDSLAELLFAIAIFGISGVALIQGLFTLAVGAGSGKKLSAAQTVLNTAAESVAAAPYVVCPAPGIYPVSPSSGYTPPSGWSGTITIASIEYWDGTGFVPACDSVAIAAAPFDMFRLQKIKLTAAPVGLPPRDLTILKRGTT